MLSIGGILKTNGKPCPTREEVQADFAKVPRVDTFVGEDERACFVANADLIPDDWAALMVEATDATNVGRRTKFVRLGIGAARIGAALGLALGVVVGKYVL